MVMPMTLFYNKNMKKVVYALGLLILPFTCSAQEEIPSPISCPPERMPQFESNQLCQGNQIEDDQMQISRIQEIVVPEFFENELDYYQGILDAIYRDNVVNPNVIAEKGILALRQHNECLREICYNAFNKCTHDLSPDKIYDQGYTWCDTKHAELDLINRTKLYYITTSNQARKETSLQKQKWQAIDTRGKQYFHHWLGKFVQNFQKFVDKVFNFIATPAT